MVACNRPRKFGLIILKEIIRMLPLNYNVQKHISEAGKHGVFLKKQDDLQIHFSSQEISRAT